MINDYLIYVTLAVTVNAIPGPAVDLTNRCANRSNSYTRLTNIASG